MRSGTRTTLGAVEVDGVGPTLSGHPNVVVDPGRAQLELDRDLVVGGLPNLLDLEREIVRSDPIWVAGRRALVDSCRQRSHLGHLFGHLLAHEVPAKAHLATLPDEKLDRVGQHEMVRVEAVPALDDLVEPFSRQVPLRWDHAALAGTGGGSGHRRPLS